MRRSHADSAARARSDDASRESSRRSGSLSLMGHEALTVSVAMATRNGAKFLESQLESIAAQTRPPLELVVCDDRSTDNTLEITRRFAVKAPFEVRIVGNPVRLGHADNFLRSARLCQGDVIAWSDQDDVWMPEKLERCVQEFERNSAVVLVVHSRRIGDWTSRRGPVVRGGKSGGSSVLARRRWVSTPRAFPIQFSTPGYASLLHRCVLEIGDSLGVDLPGDFGGDWSHDTWTAFLAAAIGKNVFVPDVLACYRQHGENTIGAPRRELRASRVQASARRESVEFVGDLQREVARSSFRAAVLRELAEKVDSCGPLRRAAMWSRRGDVRRRRLELYAQPHSRMRATVHMLGCIALGDYGRRSRGGLGPGALMRDLYRIAENPNRTG
jgi:rhamnosyltransferase